MVTIGNGVNAGPQLGLRFDQLAPFAACLLRLQRNDQFDSREEAKLGSVVFDRRNASHCGRMAFARSSTTKKHNIPNASDKLASMWLQHSRLIDFVGRKIEAR